MFIALATVAPAAIIALAAVVLIVAAIVVFLLATIVELRTISHGLDGVIPPVAELVQKTAPVNRLVSQIVGDLGAGTNLLEGLLVKKAGVDDSAGLIESVFPGGGQAFLQRQGRPGKPKHFGVVYSRGALQLARLGRGAPLGAAMRGAALRDPLYASASPMSLYPDPRGEGSRPRSPVVGGDSPVQYQKPGDGPTPAPQSPEDTPAAPQPSHPTPQPSQFTPEPSRPQHAAGDREGVIRYRREPQPSRPTPEPSRPTPEPSRPQQPAGDREGVIRYRRG